VLTLSNVIKTGRLQEVIAQEEARGIGPANKADLEVAIWGQYIFSSGQQRPSQETDGNTLILAPSPPPSV